MGYFRIAVTNKSTGTIVVYWPHIDGAGCYFNNTYSNVFIIGDIAEMEAGGYEISAQWISNSGYTMTWYGNYRGEIKLLGEIFY